jgi:hypothetical protein
MAARAVSAKKNNDDSSNTVRLMTKFTGLGPTIAWLHMKPRPQAELARPKPN